MILKVSTQYKKDLKRYQNKPSKIAALKEVLKHLKKSGFVPILVIILIFIYRYYTVNARCEEVGQELTVK